MMKCLHIAFIFSIGLLSHVAWGQQTPLYSQYYLNPYLYNPATAGQGDATQAFFQYRKQWVGVEGSPETQAFTLDGKLNNEKWGVGMSFFNDVSNVIGRINVGLSAAYTVPLSPTQDLSFGLSAMVIQNRIFFDRVYVDDISDPNLLSNVNGKTAFEGNFGFSYRWKKLRVGFAADQIFQNEIRYENAAQFQSLNFKYIRHYITTMEYDVPLGENLTIKPLVLARTAEGLPPQVDINAILDYRDIVWTGVTYRHDIGVGASLGFLIENRFVVGYSYEYPLSDLNILGTGSHEFVLGLKMRTGGAVSQVYTRQERTQLRELADENAAQYEKLDQLQQRNERNEEKLTEYEELIDRQEEELQALRKLYQTFEEDLVELKRNSSLQPEEQQQEGSDYYLVVGAFRTIEQTKQFQRILQREGKLATRVVQNNLKTWFLIYTEQLDDLTKVQEKIRALEQGDAKGLIVGNPWVFVKKPGDQNKGTE